MPRMLVEELGEGGTIVARKIKISAGILNVRLHPHSPTRYLEFIQDIYRRRQPVKVHGDRYAMLSSLDRSERDSHVLSGLITTFTRVESDGVWFDTSSLTEASEEQVSRINIPANLYPNAASYFSTLDGDSHRIFVETYSSGKTLTISSALRIFQRLSEDLHILDEYGPATISVVQDSSGLEIVFGLNIIKKITITILRPNPDIFSDDFEEQVEAHLAEAHSKKLVIGYEAVPGQSLVPTDEIQTASAVALENGKVETRGRDETGAVTRSTEDYPRILQDRYDPDELSEREAFRRLVSP